MFTRPSRVTSGRVFLAGPAFWFVLVPAVILTWGGLYYGGKAILGWMGSI